MVQGVKELEIGRRCSMLTGQELLWMLMPLPRSLCLNLRATQLLICLLHWSHHSNNNNNRSRFNLNNQYNNSNSNIKCRME